jgi:mannosyltransferase OCH1-like enzyme
MGATPAEQIDYADFVPSGPFPKRFGHIWIGDKLPPEDWMATWHVHHPDWDYQLYDNDYLLGRKWRNQALIREYFRRRKFEGVADLMRYEILLERGGVIAPADSICHRPVDDLFTEPTLYAVYESEEFKPRNISPFIGSVPGHPFLDEVITRIGRKWTAETIQDPWQSTGNRFLKFTIGSRRIAMRFLPSHTFNPSFKGRPYTGTGTVYADQMWGTTRNLYKRRAPDEAARIYNAVLEAL